MTNEYNADVAVIGGGLGGIAAALACLRHGQRVVLSEQFDWLGGQLTSQAVPPDEHRWIESFGASASYRSLRNGIRDYYRNNYPLSDAARQAEFLNPGAATVSRISHEPRVGLAVLTAMLAPWLSCGRLTVLQPYRPVGAHVDGDLVRAVDLRDAIGGAEVTVSAKYVIDATETGELLPLTGAEFVTGFESQAETGEPSAPQQAQPDNVQAFSVCFAIDHVDGDHTIDRPARYEHFRAVEPDFWGGPQLGWRSPNPRDLEIVERRFAPNASLEPGIAAPAGDEDLWVFRRIVASANFRHGAYDSDVVLVNWPAIDYLEGTLIGVTDDVAAAALADAKQQSLSMLYWMQTEAPRPDGGTGFPGLRLRGDLLGSSDGLAQAPYIRESRRIRARRTVTENEVSQAIRGDRGIQTYDDSVGVGMYRIDLHPSTGGDNYLDIAAVPFEIPLGALIPQRLRNLLPASKNIGTTHISNGCYRLHPVEWNIGESVGSLAAMCVSESLEPHQVLDKPEHLAQFQRRLAADGVEIHWPAGLEIPPA